MLLDRGVAAGRVHRELFYVGEVPPAPGRRRPVHRPSVASVTVILDGRTIDLTLPADGDSILDAVLAGRPDAPYACKGGVCGTCRARVTEGEVEMTRNYALEPDELAAGLVLACQSHPVTDRVVVDFDQ